jgi:hypothetical protein
MADPNKLTQAEKREALTLILGNPKFDTVNPHLTHQEKHHLRDRHIWPLKPVFSPYATTHDHYSQVRYKGRKYLCHRLAYSEFHGQARHDTSHILHLDCHTGRYDLVEPGNNIYGTDPASEILIRDT